MRFLRSTLIIAVLTAIAACSTRSEPTGTVDPSAVLVQDNQFNPATTTVNAGTTVRWTWQGANSHTVSFTGGGPASAVQTAGIYDRTFATPGTFPYLCAIHGVSMSGTVIVQ